MRIRCFECGKSVSTEVPEYTLVRAIVICPECIDKMFADGRMVNKESGDDYAYRKEIKS